jgi:predicted metal-dependent hydrolase
LSLVEEQDEALKLKDGRFQLLRSVMEQGGPEAAQQTFEQFYKDKGLPRIQQRVTHFAARVGVEAGEVQVRDLGFRWATCLPNGGLDFHWKCLMAPLTVIDYIVVHELCHMHHRDHSDAFWNEVDKVLPDFHDRKEWLRRRGANLST